MTFRAHLANTILVSSFITLKPSLAYTAFAIVRVKSSQDWAIICLLSGKPIPTPSLCFKRKKKYCCWPFLYLRKTQWVRPNISNLDRSDQSPAFHWSNIYSLCFFVQALLFLLWGSFCSGYSAAVQTWKWDSRRLLLTLNVIWTLGSIDVGSIWGAVNWQFLWLVTLKNLTSAAEVPPGLSFLGQSSWQLCFIIAFHVFWHSSLRNFQKLFFFLFFNPFPKFQERLTCLKSHDSLLVLWFSLLCGLWGVFTL